MVRTANGKPRKMGQWYQLNHAASQSCTLSVWNLSRYPMFFPSNVVDINQKEFVHFENFSLNSGSHSPKNVSQEIQPCSLRKGLRFCWTDGVDNLPPKCIFLKQWISCPLSQFPLEKFGPIVSRDVPCRPGNCQLTDLESIERALLLFRLSSSRKLW